MIGPTSTERREAARDSGQRIGYITGLRGEEVFLATHCEVPIPNICKCEYLVFRGDFAAEMAEVDRIAAELGTCARWDKGRYVACREFGPGVVYEAVAIPVMSFVAGEPAQAPTEEMVS
jgi:hypothetical protein